MSVKWKKSIILVFALVLLATGCSSDSGDGADPGPPEEDSSSSLPDGDDSDGSSDADGAEDSPVRFVYANPFAFTDLAPSNAFSTEHIVLQNVYETLTRFNDPGSAEQLSGVLAESWESNPESTVWTFKLRDGVTFHDGTALTAEAVQASLQRTIDLELGAAFMALRISGGSRGDGGEELPVGAAGVEQSEEL